MPDSVSPLKEQILQIIYARFEEWAASPRHACREGCAACCTLNVQITALEGRRILNYCRRHKTAGWLRNALEGIEPPVPPIQTTNEYVLDPVDDNSPSFPKGRCFFLQDNRCTIYAVRPFNCRCFISTSRCTPGDAATVSDTHLHGALAAQQLIEHLGQFDVWGNMADLLPVLEYRQSSVPGEPPERIRQAMANLRRARPLPGFCYPRNEQHTIDPLLRSILASRVEGKTVEEIFNGK